MYDPVGEVAVPDCPWRRVSAPCDDKKREACWPCANPDEIRREVECQVSASSSPENPGFDIDDTFDRMAPPCSSVRRESDLCLHRRQPEADRRGCKDTDE